MHALQDRPSAGKLRAGPAGLILSLGYLFPFWDHIYLSVKSHFTVIGFSVDCRKYFDIMTRMRPAIGWISDTLIAISTFHALIWLGHAR